jgi:hypothetical protein
MLAQNKAAAQQMEQLESYAATSEQLFGTASNPHHVTGVQPDEAPVVPGAVALVYFLRQTPTALLFCCGL